MFRANQTIVPWWMRTVAYSALRQSVEAADVSVSHGELDLTHSPSTARQARSRSSLISLGVVALAALGACQDASQQTASITEPSVTESSVRLARQRQRRDTIVVSPTSISVQSGSSAQLTATVKSSTGTTVSTTVTWASANAATATVSSTGRVTGVAAGSTTINATTSSGARTTIPVTVTASTGGTGGTGSPVVAECSALKAGWIFCDDFETDRSAKYFEVDHANNSFVRATGVGVGGSSGMRAHFAAGQVSAGSLKLAFGRTPSSYMRPVDAGTANYRDIYWRVYVRNQAGWKGGGGDKLSRAQVMANANWAQAMSAPLWSGGQSSNWNYLLMDPYSGTDANGTLLMTSYNDFAHARWLGPAQSTTPIFDASHVGQWYCVEGHVHLNDAGQSNGTFDLWINGSAQPSRTGLNWIGKFSGYGINTVFLENYWNAGAPVAQERYLDNFVVSTAKIGC